MFTPATNHPVDRPIFVVQGYAAATAPVLEVAGVTRSMNTGDGNAVRSSRSMRLVTGYR